MADISLGVCEVTQLTKMPNMADASQPATYNAQLQAPPVVARPGPPPGGPVMPLQVTLYNLPVAVMAVPFAEGSVTLGKQYEVILREVV